jgi:hypothetical protein
MAVGAWFVAAFVLAVERSGWASLRWGILAGVLAAAAVMVSYGMVLMACVPLFVAVRARAWRPVLVATATATACIAAFVPLGFSWLEGIGAVGRAHDALGPGRPYPYLLVGNLAAAAIVIGPAVAAGLAVTRDRRLWALLGGAVLAMAVADVSGLSRGGVERIWLPFAVWLLPAAASLATRHRWGRLWLAAQAAVPLWVLLHIQPPW